MVDMEIALVNRFYWNLHDIDETDIESLMPFITRVTHGSPAGETEPKMVYIDQVKDWI